jgi:DNA-binding winged helix-turn-helix (wHTH) protein
MTATAASACYRFGRFELQPDERRLLAAGALVHVGPHAFDLLIELVAYLRVAQEHSGHLVTKDELPKRLWRRGARLRQGYFVIRSEPSPWSLSA